MYWHATFAMIDRYMENNLQSALIGGYTVIVITMLMHDAFRCVGEAFHYRCIYEWMYDYLVFTACLSYIHGCRYDCKKY